MWTSRLGPHGRDQIGDTKGLDLPRRLVTSPAPSSRHIYLCRLSQLLPPPGRMSLPPWHSRWSQVSAGSHLRVSPPPPAGCLSQRDAVAQRHQHRARRAQPHERSTRLPAAASGAPGASPTSRVGKVSHRKAKPPAQALLTDKWSCWFEPGSHQLGGCSSNGGWSSRPASSGGLERGGWGGVPLDPSRFWAPVLGVEGPGGLGQAPCSLSRGDDSGTPFRPSWW